MDYDNPQFIAAVKKIANAPLVDIADALHGIANGLQQQSAAIKEQTRAYQDAQYTQRRVIAELEIPQTEKYRQETNTTKESFIKWGTLYAEAVGIIVVIAYTTVAAFQLSEMKIATKASTEASNTATKALAENTRQFDVMFGEIQAQTTAQGTSSRAAKDAAKTAENTLHVSERAYITNGFPVLDSAKSIVTFPFINGGHIPSGTVTTSYYEATFNPPDNTVPSPFSSIVERHHSTIRLDSIAPGSPVSITIPLPKLSIDLVNKGQQIIMVVGDIEYNDGFPTSPIQHTPVCAQTIYHIVAKTFYWIPCDASVELPKFQSLDWTGLTTTYPPN